MSASGDRRGLLDDVDRLADVAVGLFSGLARKAAALTTGVAMLALVVVGAAFLVGLGAFPGARVEWGIIGGLMLIAAVVTPLIASFRLLAVPRHSAKLIGELRGLLRRSDAAKRVVIDTVAYEDGDGGAVASSTDGVAVGSSTDGVAVASTTDGGAVATSGHGAVTAGAVPAIVYRSQQYSKLRTIASQSGEYGTVVTTLRRLTAIPLLLATSLALILLAGLLGFVFTLIWIF